MNRPRSITAASGDLAAVDWRRVERLEWVQPRLLAWRWELLADGATAARIQGRGLWGRGFDAHTRADSWRILEPRLFGPTSIHRGEEVEACARARIGWLGHGRIERAAGHVLGWKREGWRALNHVLANGEGFPLFKVRSGLQWCRAGATLHLEDAGRDLPDLEALILLSWALMMITRRHQST